MRGQAIQVTALGLALLLGGAPAAAEEAPRIRAVRVDAPPVIDGVLDDAIWKSAAHIDGFTQVEPTEGGVPRERTEMFIAYDENALYIGMRAHDRNPSALIATQMTQDTTQTSDDRINLLLDTFLDDRNAFFFQINPVGTRSEALIENNETFRREWDTVWYAEASIDENGWNAEFAIPFQSVNFDPEGTTWGFEAERIVRRANEKSRWANASQNRSVTDVAGIGRIEGLVGIEGTGFDLKPTYSASFNRDHSFDDNDRRGRPGLDVFYKFNPAITGALTLNTDFSDAAVDERQTNLTRFALFFPETRDFFLQDSSIFQFGGIEETNGLPFFSRRIGIVGGSVVDIDGGLKLTGRVGRMNFGALSVQTEPGDGRDATRLSVGRLQVNVLEESAVGLIATHGDPSDSVENSLFGADFRYRNSRMGASGNDIATADFWFQRSQSSGTDGREAAFGAKLAYPNDRINAAIGFTEIQENFNPTLGFVNRRGIRDYDAEFRYRRRPRLSWWRTIDHGFVGSVTTDRDANRLASSELRLDPLILTNQAGDILTFSFITAQERIKMPFLLSDDTLITPGDYTFDQGLIQLDTASGREVRLILALRAGEFYDGNIVRTDVTLEYRPSPYFFAGLLWQQNDARLPVRFDGMGTRFKGDFTQRLLRLNLNLNFTPELSWTNLVQYDNTSDSIGINSRLRWEIESGNELFLVWNQGYAVDETSVRPTTTQVVSKIGWTFRY